MSVLSKLKIESKGLFVTSIFYALAGVIFLVWMPMADFPLHIGILGIFSLVTAYGLIRKRGWTIWLVIILFFMATTFSALMIYGFLMRNYILGISMIVYLILTWVFTAYVADRRNTLQS